MRQQYKSDTTTWRQSTIFDKKYDMAVIQARTSSLRDLYDDQESTARN